MSNANSIRFGDEGCNRCTQPKYESGLAWEDGEVFHGTKSTKRAQTNRCIPSFLLSSLMTFHRTTKYVSKHTSLEWKKQSLPKVNGYKVRGSEYFIVGEDFSVRLIGFGLRTVFIRNFPEVINELRSMRVFRRSTPTHLRETDYKIWKETLQ